MAVASGLVVCMHGITSDGFDFRTTMEGWARAGIRAVEPDLVRAREFEQANGAGAARRLLDDLGQVAYSSTNQLFLDEDGDRRAQALEDLAWKTALAASLGADRLVTPSAASSPHSSDDFDQVLANYREAADIAAESGITLMLEFTRHSTLVNNLRTALHVVRTINHPNLRCMIDLFHFWAGPSKVEDLDLLEPGEVAHVHFADVPATPPPEVSAQKDRAFPGEGIAPLQKLLNKLVEKGYNRALSMELFDPQVRTTDPEKIGARALETITPYIEAANAASG